MINPMLSKLLETAIPVTKASFHAAINNGDNVPEHGFSERSEAPSRRVQMWLSVPANILIYKHKGKYFYCPNATTIFGEFKDMPEESSSADVLSEEVAPKKRGRPFKDKAE